MLAGPSTPRRASFHIGNLREPPLRPPARPSEVRGPCPFTRPVRQMMVVEVVDTGPGVSAQARKRLFMQFCQGAEDEISKPRPCSGTGLGLSICARQVRASRSLAFCHFLCSPRRRKTVSRAVSERLTCTVEKNRGSYFS
jgi:hypothetical protein